MIVETEENHDSLYENGPQKRILPVRRIFMLSSLMFFVGYSYSINEGFGIPLLLEAGLSERYAPIVFGISSIVSVFIGEYIGSASDRCTSLLGRRRPYIIGLSAVVLIAAVAYPYAISASGLFKLRGNSKAVYIISHTAVCVVLFDVFLDMTNAIDRSYLVDSITTQQNDIGNSIFSALVSAGSCIGGLVSALDWERVFKLSTGDQTKVVFATVYLVLFVCIILTLSSVKEAHIGKDGEVQWVADSRWMRCYNCCNYFTFDLYKRFYVQYELEETEPSLSYEQASVVMVIEDSVNSTRCMTENGSKGQEKISEISLSSENPDDLTPIHSSAEPHSLGEHSFDEQSSNDLIISKNSHEVIMVLENNNNMDQQVTVSHKYKKAWIFTILKNLCVRILGAINFIKSLSALTIWLWVTHLLQWITALSFNFFLTNYVASVIYKGSPDADPNSESFRNYSQGIRMGFACLSIEFGSSFIFSLLFKKVITIIRLRELCIGIHTLTFVSSGLLVIFSNIYLVASLCFIIGWFFALIQIIPFIIIQQYKVCI